MYRLWGLFLGGLLLCPQSGFTQNPKETTTYIRIDQPPAEVSAEANDMNQPFFAAPSTANEVMEKAEELDGRLKKLEDRVMALENAKVSIS